LEFSVCSPTQTPQSPSLSLADDGSITPQVYPDIKNAVSGRDQTLRVEGQVSRVWDSGFRVEVSGFRVEVSGFRVILHLRILARALLSLRRLAGAWRCAMAEAGGAADSGPSAPSSGAVRSTSAAAPSIWRTIAR
jgi:hypothetical protein